MPITILALFLITGCAKENATPFKTNTDDQQKESGALVLSYNGDNPVWEYVVVDELPSSQDGSHFVGLRDNNGNSVHAHGDFPGVDFSGTQNNGGTHGSATLNLGPFTFTCDTECLMVEDDKAVYAGIITELAGPPGFPFGVDDFIYFRVIDNGEGSDAPADQFTGAIRFRFSTQPTRCGIWTPSHPSWTNYPDIDVPEPGKIKVNN